MLPHRLPAMGLGLVAVSLMLMTAWADTVTVHTIRANVRLGPGVKYSVLTIVERGATFPLLQSSGRWLNIQLDTQRTGWIAASIVQVNREQPRDPQGESAPSQVGQEAPTVPQTGQVAIRDPQGQLVGSYAASHALLIGVSDYSNGWPDLPGVIADLEAVETALTGHGFQVQVVRDPSRQEMLDAFTAFIRRYGLEAENRLIIYFAGHGHTLAQSYGGEMGYIIPSDAPNPSRDLAGFHATAVDMQQIEVYAQRIQSKHALFLFDSCFSGSIFALSRAVPANISYKTSRPVRQFITSGSAQEQVPDESIFRRQFISALQGEGDVDGDGYITGTELGEFLQKQVVNYSRASQHPQYGKIRHPKLDKGDFVFAISASQMVAQATQRSQHLVKRSDPEVALWTAVQASGEAEDFQSYLATYPQGRFVPAAQVRLRSMQRRAHAEMRSKQDEPPSQAAGELTKTLRNSIGIDFVLIPAGEFLMGSSPQQVKDIIGQYGIPPTWMETETPQHRVRIGQPFYLSQFEVTQGQWAAIMGTNPSLFSDNPERPVDNVSWEDIQQFLQRLNAQENGTHYRLPTEAEWEYAARAGSSTMYSFGDNSDQLGAFAWCDGSTGPATHPVGQLQPNSWGLYDMHGNVWEWVEDWKGAYTAAGIVTDPQGPSAGTDRITRGGSVLSLPRSCRSAGRDAWRPSDRDGSLGFRVLRETP